MKKGEYTFAVCKLCGVQSPPIINPRNMEMQLRDMGWKLDTLKFTILATCPKCQDEEMPPLRPPSAG